MKLVDAIDVAIEQAKKSSGPFQHGCVIMGGKNIISKGNNHVRQNIGTLSIHAEMDAVWKMDSDHPNKTAIIVRISSSGSKLSSSRPCHMCMGTLKQHGIQRIVYSTSVGNLKIERI